MQDGTLCRFPTVADVVAVVGRLRTHAQHFQSLRMIPQATAHLTAALRTRAKPWEVMHTAMWVAVNRAAFMSTRASTHSVIAWYAVAVPGNLDVRRYSNLSRTKTAHHAKAFLLTATAAAAVCNAARTHHCRLPSACHVRLLSSEGIAK